ncbi:MAG: hypothetical protein ACHRHE_00745 [Tepidisphaerales bacterium]
MKALLSTAVAFACASVLWAAEPAPSKPGAVKTNPPETAAYTVHEWGTFTSFSGSDGVSLEFRPLIDSTLPAFVMTLASQAEALAGGSPIHGLSVDDQKFQLITRQRMETPVTYFYTDRVRTVSARVDFPHGLLTEFFPPVRAFGPAWEKGARTPLDGGFLDWGQIRLIPVEPAKGKSDEGLPPAGDAAAAAHYAPARETDSAIVEFIDDMHGGRVREKFLFYRGAGNFELPVKAVARDDGRVTLQNTGTLPIAAAMLVHIEKGKIAFAVQKNIGGEADLTLPAELRPIAAMEGEMRHMLTEAGLFDKEAAAMVKTWDSSWFGEPGTRVLYLLPQSYTDELLPLQLSPPPEKMLRVMVGRLEILSPQEERRIEQLVLRLGAESFSDREQATTALAQYGRFAEPALQRILKIDPDPEVQVRAKRLLLALRTEARPAAKKP